MAGFGVVDFGDDDAAVDNPVALIAPSKRGASCYRLVSQPGHKSSVAVKLCVGNVATRSNQQTISPFSKQSARRYREAMTDRPPRTTVHSGKLVYDGRPWLSVERHHITTPDGVDRHHHAVRLNPVAIVTAIDDHGRALLLQRHRWIVDTIGYESPGGIVDSGEEHESCARRELLEETGFTVERLTLVAELEPMPGLVQTPHYIFLGYGPRQVAAPADAEEAGQLVWVPLRRTAELLATGQLLGTGTAVGMLAAAANLAGGQELSGSVLERVVPAAETS
ncbi:hypothetical protein C5E45_15330 [Nocardia nova]|uniref:Nudix hydrolase domain-containing protein n=2 Tax=Nocardia nova TaxID=37330 RepID=A0A2S6AQM3_9NOCA|nr:NUDIX hydrolase [Nocardia nova]PPJ22955.1 hypothetical protein C5E41_25930 [Nocardia nova]PPJ37486.1 hypothetical protein C5E45_15330 [Nocardia nova]